MIAPIPDVLALAFMSFFPEMLEGDWVRLCKWVGEGNKTPMLNLATYHDGKIVGLFPCEAYDNRIIIHACFLPEYRGKFAISAAKQAFEWIFNNTDYPKITAYIEPDHVKKYAKLCGMKEVNGLFEVSR